MIDSIKRRIIAFSLAILLVALSIGWAAHTTWQQVEQLDERLTKAQIESFQTADQFRANLQELDLILLRYAIHPDAADREQFRQNWKKMDQWIDVQRPLLTSAKEGEILDRINAAYDDYYAEATNLLQHVSDPPNPNETPLANFPRVEQESKRLLDLAYELVGAHRDSLTRFLVESRRSLNLLRTLTFVALISLLGLGGWLAVVVYRDMIAPLQVKLVESSAIIERQEKLAALGLLSAGVAHEIRNPLTAIKARLFTQLKQLRPGSPAREDAEVISQEIHRLERIVKDFLLFARPSDPELSIVPVARPLDEVGKLLAPQLQGRGISLRVEPPPSLSIRVDPGQIKQVLINLIQNAADAIGNHGTITVRARRDAQTLGERHVAVAVLEVADTGKGIPAEVEKRLFDPFFTTKDCGTGLGLVIADRIVEKHGGRLQYQTLLNHGTVFGIVLPLADHDQSSRPDSAH